MLLLHNAENFNALVSINTEPAFIGAALMLVPEGYALTLRTKWQGDGCCAILLSEDRDVLGDSGCLSLAILAAVLAAQTPVSIADIGDDEEVK